MKMSLKLIILFSLLALMLTVANSAFFFVSEINSLNETIENNLTALGQKMIEEVEQFVTLMDYELNSLISNVEFMTAFEYIGQQDETIDNIEGFLSAQTIMSHALYHEFLIGKFYRVSAFSDNGFFLSNRFEKNDTIVNLSDEAREAVASLNYKQFTQSSLYKRHLIEPHDDIWTNARSIPVFSAVRAAIWHGRQIGYLEVSARTEELEKIFSVQGIAGITVQAVFDDNRVLYRSHQDIADYSQIDTSAMTECRVSDGSKRLVLPMRSKQLGMNIYIAQDITVHNRMAQALIVRYAITSALLLFVAIALIVVISMELTKSIRQLTNKIRLLPADNLLAYPDDDALSSVVTNSRDAEAHEMELVINNLLDRLKKSMQNEIILREGALQAQLSALQAQINPHFIYNTLNIISAKGMECGNEEIIEICDQFAQMLRYSTDLRSKTATLKDEIQHVRNYLMLAKARYEDGLNYFIDIPPEMDWIVIPKLSLQPIVENALTHGYGSAINGIHISISGAIDCAGLRLLIHDDGSGFAPDVLQKLQSDFNRIESGKAVHSEDVNGHIGLVNTYLRLFYYSIGSMKLRVYNDQGASVELSMPCLKEEDHNVPRIAGR